MYIIRDKNVKVILKILKASLKDDLKPEEVFPGFDAGTMEMAKLEKGRVPKYFDIDEKGFVVPLKKQAFMALMRKQENRAKVMLVDDGAKAIKATKKKGK